MNIKPTVVLPGILINLQQVFRHTIIQKSLRTKRVERCSYLVKLTRPPNLSETCGKSGLASCSNLFTESERLRSLRALVLPLYLNRSRGSLLLSRLLQ